MADRYKKFTLTPNATNVTFLITLFNIIDRFNSIVLGLSERRENGNNVYSCWYKMCSGKRSHVLLGAVSRAVSVSEAAKYKTHLSTQCRVQCW